MPAQFESIGTIFVAAGTIAAVPKPAGLVVGDLLVAMGIENTGAAATIAVPVGWVKHDQTQPPITTPKGFLATKIADAGDVVASTFDFSTGVAAPWEVGVLRISGALGFDAFAVAVVDNINLGNPTLPALLTIATLTMILRFTGTDTTVTEPTTVSDPVGHTRRGIEGGAAGGAGSSDAVGIWWTKDALVTPAQTVPSEGLTMAGNAGNTRSVQYTVSIQSVLPAGGGGMMGGDNPAILEPGREMIERGQKILNPFMLPKRHCMCPADNCTCV